jgi:prepilin-type processing-associated H-X9-DG protein
MSTSLDESPQGSRSRLPEVIVVAAVLFVIAAALFPAIQRVRETARCMNCVGQYKFFGMDMQEYHRIHGRFPPAYLADRRGQPAHSWRMLLLPWENDPLGKQCRFNEPWDSPHNRALAPGLHIGMSGVYPAYHCPSDRDSDRLDTSYVMVVGKGTISAGPNSVRIEDVTDGLSRTIGLAEMAESGIPWMKPEDLKFDEMSFKINDFSTKCIRSRHPGVANVGMLDCSVKSLNENIDPKVLKALLTIAGGENIPWQLYD